MKLTFVALLVGLVGCEAEDRGHILPLPVTPDAACLLCSCNPLTQGGCSPGERCTWFDDQDHPDVGHFGCAGDLAASGIAIGSPCVSGPPGPMGYDTCVKGAICVAGECTQLCDHTGGAPTCDQSHTCTRFAEFMPTSTGSPLVAGVCDPLTR